MQYEIQARGHYVYSLWGASRRRPFYIGMTSSLLLRLGTHITNPLVRGRLRCVLVETVESREAAAVLERQLIERYRPPYNIRHNPRAGRHLGPVKPQKPDPSWLKDVAAWAADEEAVDFEFMPRFCPLCGTHHEGSDHAPRDGEV